MVKGNFLTNIVLYKTAILNGNKVILFPNLLDFYMKFIVMFLVIVIICYRYGTVYMAYICIQILEMSCQEKKIIGF